MTANKYEKLIITAASKSYGPSLLALLGSINLNWPEHPPVRVYDLGMDYDVLARLAENGIEIIKVPQFCAHWRKHYTWKLWCLNDAPAETILWIDAGLVVLKPLDEVFAATASLGYFLAPNYHLLETEASTAACEGCGVTADFRIGKSTLAAGLMGFRKSDKALQVLEEAMQVGMNERFIEATDPAHRWEQAIISLLMYKHFGCVQLSDGQVYLGWKASDQVAGQRVWVHRRALHPEDMTTLSLHVSGPASPFMPRAKPPQQVSRKVQLKRFVRDLLKLKLV